MKRAVAANTTTAAEGLPSWSDVGLSDCQIALEKGIAALGGALNQAGHKSPITPAPALKKIYTGRVKDRHGVWCLEREEHGRASSGVLETEHFPQEREKEREKLGVGPGLCE